MRKIFGFVFIRELIMSMLWSSWVAVFLEEGKSLSDVCFALALFYATNALFELPTGYFADRYGRKLSTLLGMFILGLAFFLNLPTHVSGLQSVAFILAGLGSTLMSGASTAWLLTEAKNALGRRFDRDRFFLEADLVGRIATIAGAFASIGLLTASPRLVWVVAGSVGIVGAIFGLAVPDSSECSSKGRALKLSDVQSALGCALSSRIIVGLIVSTLFFGIETSIRGIIYQPYLLELTHGKLFYLAYFQATLAVARLTGNLIYKHYLAKYQQALILCVVALVVFSIAEAIASAATSYIKFVPGYVLAVIALGWFFPIRDSYLNSQLDDSTRASLLSLDSMTSKVGSAAACVVLAYLIQPPMRAYWQGGSCALALSAAALTWSRQKVIRTVHAPIVTTTS